MSMKKILLIVMMSFMLFGCKIENDFSIVDEVNKSVQTTVRVNGKYGSGSGIHVGKGRILTARHVVEGIKEVVIVDNNGNKYRTKKIQTSTTDDLAILRVSDLNIPATSIRTKPLMLGEFIYVIGTPIRDNYFNSVSFGIVSDLSSETPNRNNYFNWRDMVTIDADTHKGNSGGPVFDLDGNLVGIVACSEVRLSFVVKTNKIDSTYIKANQ